MKSQAEIEEYLELHEITMGMRWDERAELDEKVDIYAEYMHEAQNIMKRFGYTKGWISALKWALDIPSTPAPLTQEEFVRLYEAVFPCPLA